MLDLRKKEKIWRECDFKTPSALNGAVATVCKSDSSVHIIGGYKEGKLSSIHYVMKLVEHILCVYITIKSGSPDIIYIVLFYL